MKRGDTIGWIVIDPETGEPVLWCKSRSEARRVAETDRQFRIYMARVYLAQARVWRHRATELPFYWRSFWQYLEYAAKCRREAAAMREPVQGGLFA